jgi:aminopeptidase N
MLALETQANDPAMPALAYSAEQVAPMLEEWLGPRPLSALTVIDHAGQPFEDGALLVAPVSALAKPEAAQPLAHSLTHAWVQTGQPWMDEGLAQFFALQWIERTQGRAATVSALQELVSPLALGEPGFTSADQVASAAPGQPLIAAWDEMFYRRKAAAVWWMLRDLAGDDAFKATLSAWRLQPVSREPARAQAVAFEKLLEAQCHRDFSWFFNDWVLRDVGLPDLTIADVTPRLLPAGKGHSSGWLVAVTVRNDGAAVADVPLVVKSGVYSVTRRMRIAGFSSATERVVVEAQPTQVTVNDGVTPEVRTSTHVRELAIQTQ